MDIGVKDSKDLSAKKRQHIETWFREQCDKEGWFGATVVIQPERIDQALQQQGLNWLEVEGFQEAIQLVPHQHNLTIVADACDVNAERFTQRITAGLDGWPYPQSTMISEHKADQRHPVVGMASILAKEERDRRIEAMSARVGFNVGSGYPSTLQQRRRCQRWWNNAVSTPRCVGGGRPWSVFGLSIGMATCRFEVFNGRHSNGSSIHDASRIS